MTKLKIIGLIVLLASVVVWLNREPAPPAVQSVTLAADEKAKVLISDKKITVVKRKADGAQKTDVHYVPDTATVTYKDDGNVSVYVKQAGLKLGPGVGAAVIGKDTTITLDTQVAYWRRMNLHIGVGFRTQSTPGAFHEHVRLFGAVGYQLPWTWTQNTSILVGYAPVQKAAVAGLRLKF
jgi:hypothetical protein